MSDVCNRLEKVSLVLTELRDETNYELITLCLGELENIQRKSQQENLISCLDNQDNQLIEYYEKRHSEAEKIILRLEEEIEEMKSYEQQHFIHHEPSNALNERSVFWKDRSNVQTSKLHSTPPKEYFSPRAMKNLLADIELKTLNNEKEQEYHMSQMRHLEKLNTQYQDQIEEIRNQLEDVLIKESNNKTKMVQLSEEKENAVTEISGLKSEVEFLKRRLTDVEKELQQKVSNNSILETRTKMLEEKNSNLISSIQEIYQENQNLAAEKKEFEEKFQITYEEIKEKAILHMPSPEQRKLLVSINNFALKSPIAISRSGTTPQKPNISHSNPARTKNSNRDTEEDQNNFKYDKEKFLNVSKFQEKFDDEEKIVFNTLEDFLRLSNEKENLENDFLALSVNDLCRQTLSEKTKSVLSLIQEEVEETMLKNAEETMLRTADETMFRALEAPITERIVIPKNDNKRPDRKDGRSMGCMGMNCNACNVF